MHGDDVASAGVEVSTQIVSKTTELILEMIKVAIEKERNAKGSLANLGSLEKWISTKRISSLMMTISCLKIIRL